MFEVVFFEYYVLFNLCEELYWVENMCYGVLWDFIFYKDEIIVMLVGMCFGWCWYVILDVIVVLLDLKKVEWFV